MLGLISGVTSWWSTAKTVYDQVSPIIDEFDEGQDQYFGDGSSDNNYNDENNRNRVSSRRFKELFSWIKFNKVLGLV